jgi:hypothetical protein
MYNTSFIKKILLAATVVLLYSCDKDFNAIGDNLIGDDHFGLEPEKYDVVAYNQEITPIQSNGLIVNALGIYDNPVLGTTTGNFATQVALASYAPTIGDEPVIESVVLSIPYFSHATSAAANSDGTTTTTYALDSIYGAPPSVGKLKLSVYESGVQMRASSVENGTQVAQLYYTDQTDFETYKKSYGTGLRLNDSENKSENELFSFNSSEITDVTTGTDGKDVTTKVAPQMRLNLNKDFFQERILSAPAAKLATADVFQEYFRGLYFKVEKTDNNSPSNMALLNFAQGKITIKYKAKTDITTDAETVKDERTLVINLTGSTASLVNDVKEPTYLNAIQNPNNTVGDDKLYLKGGQGSLAVLELKDFASKLQAIRDNKWMVNEANLVFHIDAENMAVKGADNLQAKEPKRVYLYDLDNNTPIVDYAADGSSSITSDPRMTKVIYGGIINVDATSKRGTTYKIRLTSHIRNLIKDATAKNVRLGLVVVDDINVVASNKLKLKNSVISDAPRATVLNPLGTVLFGGTSNVADANRLKLEIYYTKPN